MHCNNNKTKNTLKREVRTPLPNSRYEQKGWFDAKSVWIVGMILLMITASKTSMSEFKHVNIYVIPLSHKHISIPQVQM